MKPLYRAEIVVNNVSSVIRCEVFEALENTFGQADFEVEPENILGVSQPTLVWPRELGVINELDAQPLIEHVTDTGAHTQRIDRVSVKAIDGLYVGQPIPRFGLPGFFPRSQRNLNAKPAAHPVRTGPVAGFAVLNVTELVAGVMVLAGRDRNADRARDFGACGVVGGAYALFR